MSITVRLWTDADLESLATDDNLLTTFFNSVGCRNKKELQILNRLWDKRKNYCVRFDSTNDDDNVISVYAVSDDSLKWFIRHQYPLAKIEAIIEIVSYTREVSL
jgi:hypothetical protein